MATYVVGNIPYTFAGPMTSSLKNTAGQLLYDGTLAINQIYWSSPSLGTTMTLVSYPNLTVVSTHTANSSDVAAGYYVAYYPSSIRIADFKLTVLGSGVVTITADWLLTSAPVPFIFTTSTTLGNTTTVIDATTMAGSDWGQKVEAARTKICVTEGYTGGTIDTRGLTGAQVMTAPFTNHVGCAIRYIMGDMTLTLSAGVGIGFNSGDSFEGIGSSEYPYVSGTVITGNGTTPMVYQFDPTTLVDDLLFQDMTVYNFINAPNAPGIPKPNDMAFFIPNATHVRFKRVAGLASYGLYNGSMTNQPFRKDIDFSTGCNCYWTVEDSQFVGWVAGLVVTRNANANLYENNQFSGQFGGTAVWVDSGAYDNIFGHVIMESSAIGIDMYGYSTSFELSKYTEAVSAGGSAGGTPNWAAAYPYLAGQSIVDSSVTSAVLHSAGTAYSSSDTFAITGGNAGAVGVIDTVSGGGAVLTFHLTAYGTGYAAHTNVATTTGGGGSGFTVDTAVGRQQKCIVGGTSAGSPPVWKPFAGGVVCENTNTAPCWQMTANPVIIREPGSFQFNVSGAVIPGQLSGITEDLTAMDMALVSQPNNLQASIFQPGTIHSFGAQAFSGGTNFAPLTFGAGDNPLGTTASLTCTAPTAATPTVCYHLANPADAHTTTVHYWVDLVTQNNVQLNETGLSSEATLTNTPNTIGTARTFTVASGGIGLTAPYAPSDTITMSCAVGGCLTAPVITVDTVDANGKVLTGHISTPGTGVQAQTYVQASSSGTGVGFTANIDSNYIVIVPPLITVPGMNDLRWQYPNDAGGVGISVLGRTLSSTRLNLFGGTGPGRPSTFCPTISGAFCDAGWATSSFTAASRNSTGDVVLGGGAQLNGQLLVVTFATLGSPVNGVEYYCSDCKNVIDDSAVAGAACASSGSGAIARRENGHWACN